jgi:nucleoside-diphosphate-sugar epimerase
MPTPHVADGTVRRIAITGATGFIGRSIVRELRGRGWRLRALVRRPAPEMADDVEQVQGSMEDAASLSALVCDTAAVVHCAGAIRAVRRSDFRRVNAVGTRRLLAAVQQAPEPPRVLLLSSLAAREPRLSAYAASKREAEDMLARCGVDHCTIRPPAVYGPGDRSTLPLFRSLTRAVAVLPGSPRSRFSLIFVDDLAACVAAVIDRPLWKGSLVEPDDGQPHGYAWADLAAIAGRSLGIRVRPLLLPKWLLWLPTAIIEALASVLGRLPAITLGKLRELYHHDWVSRSTAQGLLDGWRASTRFSEGFARTLRWYVRNGWISAPSNVT